MTSTPNVGETGNVSILGADYKFAAPTSNAFPAKQYVQNIPQNSDTALARNINMGDTTFSQFVSNYDVLKINGFQFGWEERKQFLPAYLCFNRADNKTIAGNSDGATSTLDPYPKNCHATGFFKLSDDSTVELPRMTVKMEFLLNGQPPPMVISANDALQTVFYLKVSDLDPNNALIKRGTVVKSMQIQIAQIEWAGADVPDGTGIAPGSTITPTIILDRGKPQFDLVWGSADSPSGGGDSGGQSGTGSGGNTDPTTSVGAHLYILEHTKAQLSPGLIWNELKRTFEGETYQLNPVKFKDLMSSRDSNLYISIPAASIPLLGTGSRISCTVTIGDKITLGQMMKIGTVIVLRLPYSTQTFDFHNNVNVDVKIANLLALPNGPITIKAAIHKENAVLLPQGVAHSFQATPESREGAYVTSTPIAYSLAYPLAQGETIVATSQDQKLISEVIVDAASSTFRIVFQAQASTRVGDVKFNVARRVEFFTEGGENKESVLFNPTVDWLRSVLGAFTVSNLLPLFQQAAGNILSVNLDYTDRPGETSFKRPTDIVVPYADANGDIKRFNIAAQKPFANMILPAGGEAGMQQAKPIFDQFISNEPILSRIICDTYGVLDGEVDVHSTNFRQASGSVNLTGWTLARAYRNVTEEQASIANRYQLLTTYMDNIGLSKQLGRIQLVFQPSSLVPNVSPNGTTAGDGQTTGVPGQDVQSIISGGGTSTVGNPNVPVGAYLSSGNITSQGDLVGSHAVYLPAPPKGKDGTYSLKPIQINLNESPIDLRDQQKASRQLDVANFVRVFKENQMKHSVIVPNENFQKDKYAYRVNPTNQGFIDPNSFAAFKWGNYSPAAPTDDLFLEQLQKQFARDILAAEFKTFMATHRVKFQKLADGRANPRTQKQIEARLKANEARRSKNRSGPGPLTSTETTVKEPQLKPHDMSIYTTPTTQFNSQISKYPFLNVELAPSTREDDTKRKEYFLNRFFKK
jgi:hypothetical protein